MSEHHRVACSITAVLEFSSDAASAIPSKNLCSQPFRRAERGGGDGLRGFEPIGACYRATGRSLRTLCDLDTHTKCPNEQEVRRDKTRCFFAYFMLHKQGILDNYLITQQTVAASYR